MPGTESVCPEQQGRTDVGGRDLGEASTGFNDGEWLKSIARASRSSGSQKGQIHKVPTMLRENENFSKFYKPRVVSIGPYHYSNCEQRIDEIKRNMAKDFAGNFPGAVEATIEGWYDKILGQIKGWRECYEENSTGEHDDHALARMLLLDGCFILQYIDKTLSQGGKENYFQDLKVKNHELAFMQLDLFLLENQLPYGVLKTLMGSKEQDMKDKIRNFIYRKLINPLESDNPKNTILTPFCCKPRRNATPPQNSNDPSHLLELLRELLLGNSTPNPNPSKNTNTWNSFRNVKELIAVGIELKRSDTYCLRNVTCTPFLMKSELQLPQINVDDSTAAKFLNLIAYEMCPGAPDDFGVTSYVCFLDSLIDHPDDVKQLRDARILHNFLGSDQEVAELFNNIGTDLVPNDEAYRDVKHQIQLHYGSRVRSWVALFLHEHFSTPWTVLAFMGAMAGLVITSITSYYALFPSPSACEDFCSHL